jgi:predicted choloylglycine hydrolase
VVADEVLPEAGERRELPVTFRSIVELTPGAKVAELFSASWPAYRRWFLRDGPMARPSYVEASRALEKHMPELVPTYERLVDLAGGGDLEARFLSHWNPTPFFSGCSMVAWPGSGGPALLRNYDYVPSLCDTMLLTTCWNGSRVLAMSDCVWGVLDGVNEHGLAVALSFGGRRVLGDGFSVTLALRYVLELCRDVSDAIEALRRVPINLAYNVALVDRAGSAAVVWVSPDRPAVVTPGICSANRQGETEWPEHAELSATVAREATLEAAIAEPEATLRFLEDVFLTDPVYRPPTDTPWSTVYTATYDTTLLSVRLLWPDEEWRIELRAPGEEERTRIVTQILPPLYRPAWRVPFSAPVIVD